METTQQTNNQTDNAEPAPLQTQQEETPRQRQNQTKVDSESKQLGLIYDDVESEEDEDFVPQEQVEKRDDNIMTRKRTREERDKQEEKVDTPQSIAKKAKAFQDADAIWAEMKSVTTKKPQDSAPTTTAASSNIGWNELQKKVPTKTNERVATPMPNKETAKGVAVTGLSSLFPVETKESKSMEDLWAEFNEGKDVSANTNAQVDQTFSFAGENIRVGGTVDTRETTTKKGTNLADLVSNLTAQPKKLSTVQKSSIDWSQFKNEKGIVEELEQAKKDGYLEKQAFLQRADLRKYENEKNLRNKERARKKEL